MKLCTQADVGLLVGFAEWTPDPDPKIARLIDLASAKAADAAGVSFDPETGTTRAFTGGTPTLWLARRPLTDVAAVTEDGAALVAGEDYVWNETGVLRRIGRAWSDTPAGIVVTYSSGFADTAAVPDSLAGFVAALVAREYRRSLAAKNVAGMEGLSEVTLDGRSARQDTTNAPTAQPVALSPTDRQYMRKRWGARHRTRRIE